MSEFSRFPAPVDDGGAAGLEGKRLPGIELASTSGSTVDLSRVGGTLVLYVYPHATGTTDMPAPGWAAIPGAIGCTAESCAFRDREASFQALEASVMGLSAQSTDAQSDFAARKDIKFPLLSDPDRKAHDAYGAWGDRPGRGEGVIRSTFLVDERGKIKNAWYGVKPEGHAKEVLDALKS